MSIRIVFIFLFNSLAAVPVWAQTATEPSALTTSAELAPTRKRSSGLKETLLKSTGLDKSVQALEQTKESASKLVTESLPDLGLKIKAAKKDVKEKVAKTKNSKNEYEGLSIIKLYTRFGSGDREVVEEFHVLRNPQTPSPYVRELFWYDQKSRRVSSAVIRERENTLLLHGSYKRYQGGDLLEEGFFYAGMRDGRWEKYDSKYMLTDKTRWQRGFPSESRIAYYDSTHTKIKEVMPMEYGKVKGTYYAFYENGLPAEEGKYDNGVKVGRWTEFYPTTAVGRKRKKLTQYAVDRWDANFEPYVISEWSEGGKLTYERPKEKRVVTEEESDSQ